ncbi:hypothetical protein [Methanoplanus endosymbiosus]|uniref:Uncharacterized protein n=1 Tax=Methanoplanus endosymbiosus TaxID=33865 RepID=A0A9E7TKU0_9EURY|nr:hypothetical protein [Methanoplanus endosymbiosus]UUX92985.1 hypothetical protein L6E24_02335 [Methanoplanus endosymbiosus]
MKYKMGNFFSEYKSDIKSLSADKSKLKIGIFGSFAKNNFIFLENLKSGLIKRGYKNCSFSKDYEIYAVKDDSKNGDDINLAASEMLIDNSQAHILFFFREDDVNTPYNQSAIIEIAKIDERNMDNVLVLYEEEFTEKQCKTLFRGIISRHDKDKNWVQESFSKSDDNYTLDVASAFCYNCLLED